MKLDQRDDYWGGELAVPTLYYVSYNDNTALTTALANGDADWAQAFIPNIEDAFLSKDENNKYWAPAGLGIDALWFNTTSFPFDNKALRQAVARSSTVEQHVDIAREGLVPGVTSVTGLPTPAGDAVHHRRVRRSGRHGRRRRRPRRSSRRPATPGTATTSSSTRRARVVTFTIQVPQGWSDYVTGITLIADSVKALGIDATVDDPGRRHLVGRQGHR